MKLTKKNSSFGLATTNLRDFIPKPNRKYKTKVLINYLLSYNINYWRMQNKNDIALIRY